MLTGEEERGEKVEDRRFESGTRRAGADEAERVLLFFFPVQVASGLCKMQMQVQVQVSACTNAGDGQRVRVPLGGEGGEKS